MIFKLATAAVAGAVTVLLAFRSGGYFPSEWGLQIGFFALVALVAVVLAESMAIGPREGVVIGSLVALAGWSLLSIAWSPGADAQVLSAERILVYLAAVVAMLVSVTRDRLDWLIGGAGAGIVVVCVYALETRLIEGTVTDPGAITGTRLDAPIGYANALGALAAIGIVLALGFVFHERLEIRIPASAALVPLSVTLYLTLSRGSLIALAVALLVFLSWEQSGHAVGGVLAAAVPPAAAVLLAARSPVLDAALTHARAEAGGHQLAWKLALLTAAGGAVGVFAGPRSRRLTPVAWISVAGLAAAGAAAILWAGPVDIGERVADSFRSPPPAAAANPGRRVLSVASSGRSEYWDVAWSMVVREPVLGEGAGTYARWWLQERPVANDARNAHNLYLETAAELGPVGLLLLALALGAPLFAWASRRPVLAAALAADVAWLVHALLDWDWQIPGVTLVALACASALLIDGRPSLRTPPRLRTPWRVVGVALVVPLLAAGLVVHVGNRATDAGRATLDAGNANRAVAQARRARHWQPWAGEPWQLLGEAQLALHQDGAARASLRRAVDREPDSWTAWSDLAAVTTGAAKADALGHVRRLDPLVAAHNPDG